MLLLLELISLLSLAFGQFYGGHPLMATDGMGALGLTSYSPGSAGDSETLPISQDELAQLMAQSLASSSGGYGHQPQSGYQQQHHVVGPSDESVANYEAGDDAGSSGTIAHNQPEEYAKEYANEGQYAQQDAGEASPYHQQSGHHQQQSGPHQQQEDSQEPQQNYREQSEGYQSSPPSYQQESDQYQSGQYPDSGSSSYGPQSSQGSHQESPPSYESQTGSHYSPHSRSNAYSPRGQSQSYSQNTYNPQSGYQRNTPNNEYGGSAAGPQSYTQESDSYSAPGSGYAGPGSDSYLSYNVEHSPTNKYYRN